MKLANLKVGDKIYRNLIYNNYKSILDEIIEIDDSGRFWFKLSKIETRKTINKVDFYSPSNEKLFNLNT